MTALAAEFARILQENGITDADDKVRFWIELGESMGLGPELRPWYGAEDVHMVIVHGYELRNVREL